MGQLGRSGRAGRLAQLGRPGPGGLGQLSGGAGARRDQRVAGRSPGGSDVGSDFLILWQCVHYYPSTHPCGPSGPADLLRVTAEISGFNHHLVGDVYYGLIIAKLVMYEMFNDHLFCNHWVLVYICMVCVLAGNFQVVGVPLPFTHMIPIVRVISEPVVACVI